MDYISRTEVAGTKGMRPLGRTGLEGGKILKTVMKEYALVPKNGFVWFGEEISDVL
jgi:hypothetical protein